MTARDRGRPQPHRDSNLDLLSRALHDFENPIICPCLPVVMHGWADDGEVVVRFMHDAIVARVLRAERGHP